MATLGFALLAGILSTLSPCTIPLLPIILGAALTEHRFGPLALAGGLALSFVVIGLVVATVGFSAGLDQGVFRIAAAILLIIVSSVLTLPSIQTGVAAAAGQTSNWIQDNAGGFSTRGLCWLMPPPLGSLN